MSSTNLPAKWRFGQVQKMLWAKQINKKKRKETYFGTLIKCYCKFCLSKYHRVSSTHCHCSLSEGQNRRIWISIKYPLPKLRNKSYAWWSIYLYYITYIDQPNLQYNSYDDPILDITLTIIHASIFMRL